MGRPIEKPLVPMASAMPKPVDDRHYVQLCRVAGGFPSIRQVRNHRGEPRLTPEIIPASF